MGRSRRLRLPRRPWQAVLFFVAILLIAALREWRPDWFSAARREAPPASAEDNIFHVARVIDGDTLLLREGQRRVRLIGANTPETIKPNWPVEPWGPEASEFTKKFLAGGEVRLEYDGPRHDKYGRTLAFVWVGDRMLNEELIRAGLARAETQYTYSEARKAAFRRAEAEARSARRGIWSGDGK